MESDDARSVTRRGLLHGAAAGVLSAPLLAAQANAAPAVSVLPIATDAVAPFTAAVPQGALDDLKRRLEMTRWPQQETVSDWSQGAPLAKVRALADYWLTKYDWRRCEAMLNGFGQFRTRIDGLGIHFLHVRSKHENALPLLITHGWPGSVIEFHKIIRPLTDPTAHGGKAQDAFHVIAPSIPGYGFSDAPTEPGWTSARIAAAWATLMKRLGYTHYVAQGGDWGASITNTLAQQKPQGLAAIHLNVPIAVPRAPSATPTKAEQEAFAALAKFQSTGSGYFQLQSTRPQTIGYALADTPVGLAAWIYEKFYAWSDNQGDPESIFTRDEMLDDITLYWLTNTGTSSARIYYENAGKFGFSSDPVDLPVGCSIFPKEIFRCPKSWAEAVYSNLFYWNELPRGGHFAAFEQPKLFVNEMRACFRTMRA